MKRRSSSIPLLAALFAIGLPPAPADAGPGPCKFRRDMRASVEVTMIDGVATSGPAQGKLTALGMRKKFKPKDKSSVFHSLFFGDQYSVQGCRIRSKKDFTCSEAVNLSLFFDDDVDKKPTLSCGQGAFITYTVVDRNDESVVFEASSCTVQIQKNKKGGRRLAGVFEAVFEDFAGNEFRVTKGCFKSKANGQSF